LAPARQPLVRLGLAHRHTTLRGIRLHHIAVFGDQHRQGSLTCNGIIATAGAGHRLRRRHRAKYLSGSAMAFAAWLPARGQGEGDGHVIIFCCDVCDRLRLGQPEHQSKPTRLTVSHAFLPLYLCCGCSSVCPLVVRQMVRVLGGVHYPVLPVLRKSPSLAGQ
jgi:hypothetical protein